MRLFVKATLFIQALEAFFELLDRAAQPIQFLNLSCRGLSCRSLGDRLGGGVRCIGCLGLRDFDDFRGGLLRCNRRRDRRRVLRLVIGRRARIRWDRGWFGCWWRAGVCRFVRWGHGGRGVGSTRGRFIRRRAGFRHPRDGLATCPVTGPIPWLGRRGGGLHRVALGQLARFPPDGHRIRTGWRRRIVCGNPRIDDEPERQKTAAAPSEPGSDSRP